MQKYLYSCLLPILLICININLVAQDSTQQSFPGNHYALQFQIKESFSISEFNGGIVSGKYLLNNLDQIRIGLYLGVSDDNSISGTEKRESNSYSFLIHSQYLLKISSFHDIIFYSGGGPYLGYSSSEMSTTYGYGVPDITTSKTTVESETIEYGFSFAIGTEWFLKNNLSLSLEYGFSFGNKIREDYVSDDIQRNKMYDGSSFRLVRDEIKFGVSFYF